MEMNKKSNALTLNGIANVLSKLAEKSDSVYWLSSPDFSRVAYISPAYDKIWGRSREDIYNNPDIWITHLHPDDVRDYHPILAMKKRVEELGAAARYIENYRIIRPDGETRWISDRGFPIYDDETGECCGITGIAIDVTREKIAEHILRKAKEEAELADQLKTEFIRNMEHDIRTPLSGIQGLAAILRAQESSTSKRDLLDDIMHCARDLLDYCNGILDFSRIEAGTLPLLEKNFDVRHLLADILSIEKPAAHAKNLTLTANCTAQMPVMLNGDIWRLRHILINLVSNAIKFTFSGHVSIHVYPVSRADNNSLLTAFSVDDSGIGIEPEKQEIIYEKFARLSPASHGRHKGPGLGLRIVRQFVNEMGGRIELKSTPGKGSTFTCILPFQMPEPAAPLASESMDQNKEDDTQTFCLFPARPAQCS